MNASPRFRHAPGRGFLADEQNRCALLDEVIARPDTVMSRGRVLKHDGTTTVTVIGDGDRKWVVKRYNTKNHWHAVRRLMRTSRAETCWRAAGWLAQAGIDTARSVAVIEERHWRHLRGRSFFICEFIGGETLDKVLDRKADEHLIDRATGIVRRLREAGIVHGDLKATNFLVSGDHLYLVDLDATHRASGRRLRSGLRKDHDRFLRNWEERPELLRQFRDRLKPPEPV